MTRPMIGITLGDPGGIGPEIIFKTLLSVQSQKSFVPVLFGAKSILTHPYLKPLVDQLDSFEFIDCYPLSSHYAIGMPDAQNGSAAFAFIESALSAIQTQKIQAILTAPICKESFKLAGVPFLDHTTLLQSNTQSSAVNMAFYTPALKTVLATIHNPYKDVPHLLTKKCLIDTIKNTYQFANILRIQNPRIAIAGLNPHAGENGLFGTEEQDILVPIIQQMEQDGYPIIGPIPPDTVYYRAVQGDFDIVISLYHDQGLIPIKLLGFHDAVNITLGLPFLRTSPDHGTAFDKAYAIGANPASCIAALELLLQHG